MIFKWNKKKINHKKKKHMHEIVTQQNRKKNITKKLKC